MRRIHLTKKKIVGIALLFVVTNIVVNISLTMPLAYMDYKLLSFEYLENKSTREYSYLLARIMVRNNYWLPAKVDVIKFQITESVSGKVCGEGLFGPVNIDPGHFDIIKIVIKLYKNDATQNFIKEFIRTQKINGKIKAYYPVSLFGLVTMFRLPAEMPISSLLGGDSVGALTLLPTFDVEDIRLTEETSEYAEALINISGKIPTEFSKIGSVKIWDAEFNIITDKGHVVSMNFDKFTLDPRVGKFMTMVRLRFIKGEALQDFLDKAIKGKEISGKIRGKLSIEIFGINVTGATYEADLSQYGNVFESTKTSSGGIFTSISNMLRDIISGVRIRYHGKTGGTYGDEHKFSAEILINNNLNWTLGWGNINITMLSTGNKGEQYPCIRIIQNGDFTVSPGEEQKFVVNVTLYDNDGLDGFMRKVLYERRIDANLTGSIDLYFAGVWIRNIDIGSPIGSSLIGDTAEQAGMFDSFMPMGTNIGSLIGDADYGVSSFDVLATDQYLLVRARINMTYSRMPIRIYNIHGDIIYKNTHIGSVSIDEINLNQNTGNGIVVCTPRVEIRLEKSSLYLNQFIGSFVSGEWSEGTVFIGSLDLDFLSKTYRNVPIEYSGNIIGEGSGVLPIDALLDFYEIKNATYIGERYENGQRVYDIRVDAILHNIIGATIEIRYIDVELVLASNNVSFARIYMDKNVIISSYGSKDIEIYLSIYDNNALVTYLNKTLRGQSVEILMRGKVNITVGGVEINLDNLKGHISSSITDKLAGSIEATSYLYGTDMKIINMTEYPNRIEISINARVGIPLPVKVKSFFAYVSIYQDSVDPPVTLELMDEINGPGVSNATFRLVLHNSSSEFEDFIKDYVYGDISDLFANAFVDIEIFGHEFKGIELRKVKISTRMGEQESVFSVIKIDEMIRINGFEYLGIVEKDGMLAYALNLSIEIDNAFGVSFTLYDSKIYIIKNGIKIMRIDITGVYDVASYENKTLYLTLYVYNNTNKEPLKQFLEEIIMEQIFDAEISGTLSIKIFGVDIPNIEFLGRVFIDLSKQSGIANYQDIGLMLGAEIDSVEVIFENNTITSLNVTANISAPRLPVIIYSTKINISLPEYNTTAISVSINNVINLYNRDSKTISLLVDLYKHDVDHIREILKRIIENKLYALSVEGESEVEIFGVNLSLKFSYDNISLLPTTSEMAIAGLSTDIPMSIEKIEYLGQNEINGEKAYKFYASISVKNILNTTIIIGPMNISITRNNETAVEIILNRSILHGLSISTINMTIIFYGRNSTYEFLRDLIEERIVNCTFLGYGNISIFGIDINNVYLSYPILMELRESLLESAPSNMPGMQQIPTNISVVLLNSTEWYSDVQITVNITNNMTLPIKIWNITLYVIKDNQYVFLIRLIEPIDLGEENITIKAWIRFFKTSAIDAIIREVLSGNKFPVQLFGNATFRFLEWNFTAQIDISEIEYSTEGIPSGEAPIYEIEIMSSEKIGDALYVYLVMTLDKIPIPLTIRNLNISLSNEYGEIGRVFIEEAEIGNNTQSTLNITLILYDKNPNYALEYFIRRLVEENHLYLNITGTTDAILFGLIIENISIDFRINQTLQGGGGIPTESFIPLESFFAVKSVEQITFGDRNSYDLSVNVSVSSPIDTLIRIANVNVSLYVNSELAAKVIIDGSYNITYSNDTNISMLLTIYDTEGANKLLNSLFSGEAISMTVVGTLDLYILGANISNLHINYTFTFTMDKKTYSENTNIMASSMFSYILDEIKILGEDGQIANISAIVSVTEIPIYMQINNVNLTIANQYGDIGRVIINGPTILSPENISSLEILISVYRGKESLKKFIEDYLKYSNATVSLSGYIDIKLFSSTNQYLTIKTFIEIENITFTMNNTGESLIPLDTASIIQYEDMEYLGVDNSTGVNGYVLRIWSAFANKFNITFIARNVKFDLQYQNTTIISGIVPEINIKSNENKTIEANITIYDLPETAEFLQNLISNYHVTANVSIWVSSIEIFGVEISNISLNQIFGWNLTQQLEGTNVQSSVLTLFDIRMGEIVVLGEDNDTAKMKINITVYNAKIPVNVSEFEADIYYSKVRVANVYIETLEINNTKNTSFSVNITIFKHNKTALRGFLMDLLVNKNITIDIWGNASINLFGSEHINLNVTFKYNNTEYAVSDYYDSLMSGEIDTSSFLDQIIKYSAEDVKWKIVGENKTHVIMRLNESLWSALNLKIFRMYTKLYIDPLNASTIFAIQRIIDYFEVTSNSTSEISIEIVFIKNKYLQQFLDSILHNWTINVWANTIVDLEIFGVNITGLEALSAKFSYIITMDTIQGALNSLVEGYTNDVNAGVVALQPVGYGNWYDPNDPYGGIEVVVKNQTSYAYRIWEYPDKSLINIWDYSWILIKYVQEAGGYDFNVTLLNFKAILVFSGTYENGTKANGTADDFFGEIYIDNLTLVRNKNNTFFAYIRLWRLNRLRDLKNSSLRDWLWNMVKYKSYNFSILNVTFDIQFWGCNITNITIDRLNLTGIYDPSGLSDTIKFKGLTSYSVGFNLNQGVYADVTFKIEVPMTPVWLVYYYMLIVWDDDPIFFEDVDSGPDDPPAAGGYAEDNETPLGFNESGTTKKSEVEEFKALDPNAQPLAHNVSKYYEAPLMVDAPSGLPDYVVWFGTGGEYELNARIDIEWDDGHHDYFGNVDVDQKYDDEYYASQGLAEQEDANGDAGWLLNWEGVEDGDMWVLVMFSYEVEMLMFWWVIYYYTPAFYICSGDWNPNVISGFIKLYETEYWELHDYSNTHVVLLVNINGTMYVKPHPNATYMEQATVSGTCFFDSYDGAIDSSEPDYSGNYFT